MHINIEIADYFNQKQAQDIIYLLNYYSIAPEGGGKELTTYTKEHLIQELIKLPFAFSILCYIDENPAGLVNCFTVFSTFQCKPIINIHDLIVINKYRRKGISQMLLNEVEKVGKQKNACKITLEVLENNYAAINSYHKFGFSGYELNPKYGKAIFLEKIL